MKKVMSIVLAMVIVFGLGSFVRSGAKICDPHTEACSTYDATDENATTTENEDLEVTSDSFTTGGASTPLAQLGGGASSMGCESVKDVSDGFTKLIFN